MRFPQLLFLCVLMAALSSCVPQQMLNETRKRQARIHNEIIQFYDNMADAYFLVGWEYFELAQEMEEAGESERAQKFATKASVFSDFSMKWKRNAQVARERAGQESPALAAELE